MINKFQKVISWIILVCLAIFTSIVFIQMWSNYFSKYLTTEPLKNVLVLFIALIATLLVGYLLYKLRSDKPNLNRWILLLMLIIFAIIAIFWINFVPPEQVSDFHKFWFTAPDALKGKAIYTYDNDYFAKWAYQTGFLAYVMGVIKIFGYHVAAIQYLNVLYQVIILLLAYKIVEKIFNNVKMARLSLLLLMIDLDWFALNSQADNQYIGSMLFLLTFYLILQNKYWTYALAGLTLALGAIVRPIGPVIIAGIVVFAIFYLWMNNDRLNWDALVKVALTLVIYLIIFAGAGAMIKSSGLNEYGLSNRDSEWKLVIGLDYRSTGTYDAGLVNQFDLKASRATMKKQEMKVIKQNIDNVKQDNRLSDLLWNKNSILWAQRANTIDFTGIEVNHSQKTIKWVQYAGYIGSILIIIFSWIGSLVLFKKKDAKGIFLLVLPLMAFVIVQLFIEVQGRYRVEFVPVLAMLGSVGFYSIYDFFTRWGKRWQKHLN